MIPSSFSKKASLLEEYLLYEEQRKIAASKKKRRKRDKDEEEDEEPDFATLALKTMALAGIGGAAVWAMRNLGNKQQASSTQEPEYTTTTATTSTSTSSGRDSSGGGGGSSGEGGSPGKSEEEPSVSSSSNEEKVERTSFFEPVQLASKKLSGIVRTGAGWVAGIGKGIGRYALRAAKGTITAPIKAYRHGKAFIKGLRGESISIRETMKGKSYRTYMRGRDIGQKIRFAKDRLSKYALRTVKAGKALLKGVAGKPISIKEIKEGYGKVWQTGKRVYQVVGGDKLTKYTQRVAQKIRQVANKARTFGKNVRQEVSGIVSKIRRGTPQDKQSQSFIEFEVTPEAGKALQERREEVGGVQLEGAQTPKKENRLVKYTAGAIKRLREKAGKVGQKVKKVTKSVAKRINEFGQSHVDPSSQFIEFEVTPEARRRFWQNFESEEPEKQEEKPKKKKVRIAKVRDRIIRETLESTLRLQRRYRRNTGDIWWA